MVVKEDTETLTMWHDRLGHPGSMMMRRIIKNSYGHTLKGQKILQNSKIPCEACSLGKLIMRLSPAKIKAESPTFLERIKGDICEPIHPQCDHLLEASINTIKYRNDSHSECIGPHIYLQYVQEM